MPSRPTPSLLKLAALLFKDKGERQRFVEAMLEGVSREQAMIVLENRPELGAFPKMRPEPWQPDFVLRVMDSFRPAKHPLYQKGAYYTLDFSSVFAARPMLEIAVPPQTVLDLCASPGGKAIFAWRAFKPELLACNETIRKRAQTLIDNLTRCKVASGLVWTADPSVWAKRYPSAFDLVVVDAPCSGQSLLAKGDAAPECFDPKMIDMCVGRQRRIVGNAARCVRPGGHLLYATCTFTPKENERVVEWLVQEYPEFESVEVPAMANHRSAYSEAWCYRLFPHQSLGAGAFTALLRRKGEPPAERFDFSQMPALWRYGESSPKAAQTEEAKIAAPQPGGHQPRKRSRYRSR